MKTHSKILFIFTTIICISCKNRADPLREFNLNSNSTFFCFVDGSQNNKCNAGVILDLIKNNYKPSASFGFSKCKFEILSGSSFESQKLYVEFDSNKHVRIAKGGSAKEWNIYEPNNPDADSINHCENILQYGKP